MSTLFPLGLKANSNLADLPFQKSTTASLSLKFDIDVDNNRSDVTLLVMVSRVRIV